MATYVPVATDPADPVSSRFVGSAAEEFRTLKNRTKGALVVPLTDPVPGFVPAIATRAGKGLGFDASGNPVVFTISGTADPSLRADLAAAGGVALVNGAVSSSDLQKQTYVAFTAGGIATAYTLTPSPAITAYAANQLFWVNFPVISGAAPTLAISGVATPPNLVKRNGDGTLSNIAAGDIPIGTFAVLGLSATQYLVLNLPTRRLAQIQETTTNAMSTGATQIPHDDTIPQITEGNQYLSLAFTPTNAGSRLEIEVHIHVSSSVVNTWQCVALFDGATDAIAATEHFEPNMGNIDRMILTHSVSAGSTAARTYTVRAGASVASTTTVNGSGGVRSLGGALVSKITIKEYLP